MNEVLTGKDLFEWNVLKLKTVHSIKRLKRFYFFNCNQYAYYLTFTRL